MLSPRLGLLFFVFSTVKTVDDHCGYALPWDPMQHITSNNAAYHDIHHQSWGIKTNFSQPFFTIWDRWLGTRWEGDTKLKYERARAAAAAKKASPATNGKANGAPNGKANGTPNGKTNGTPNGKTNGAPNGKANGKPRHVSKSQR